jgi:hypothetical protein
MSTFNDDTLHRQAMLLREVLNSIVTHRDDYPANDDQYLMGKEMATMAKYAVLCFDDWLAKNSAHPDGRCPVCACNVNGRVKVALRKLVDAKMELDDLLKLTQPAEKEEQCPD